MNKSITILTLAALILSLPALHAADIILRTTGTQSFSATVLDQFGDPMTSQPPVNWTATGGTLAPSTGASTTYTAGTTLGTNYSLTATSDSLTANRSIEIVNDRPPVADAGADLIGTIGSTLTLDGTASSDPDGDTLTYAWTQTTGPTVPLASANTATPSFTATATATTYTFSLTVSSNGLSSTADTVSIATLSHPAGLKRDYWTGISGNTLANLTSSANYPNNPTGSDTLTRAEATSWTNAATTSNLGDNYGQRIRGYLIPETSGNYTFWISSDDYSSLLLSTDGTAANATQIASLSNWSSQYQYTKNSTQKSAPIPLVAGQAYYLEILHKEGSAGDNLSVAWSTNASLSPTSANIIPHSVLRAYTDGTPPAPATPYEIWTAGFTWNGKPSGPNEHADTDGMNNFLEYALGLDPLVDDPNPLSAEVTGTQFSFSYPRARAELTYNVETCNSLSPDSWTTNGVTQDTTTPVGSTATATVEIPLSTPGTHFLRLRITP